MRNLQFISFYTLPGLKYYIYKFLQIIDKKEIFRYFLKLYIHK